MSLTSNLNNLNSPVRQFMERTFPTIAPVLKAARPTIVRYSPATIRPSSPIPYAMIGGAIDYRIRYYFEITDFVELVAFKGATIAGLNPFRLHHDCMRLLGTLPADALDFPLSIEETARRERGEENPDTLFFLHLHKRLDELQPVRRRLEREEERELCRLCVVLSIYEELFRAGTGVKSPLYELEENTLPHILAMAEEHWLDDLCNLSWCFYENFEPLLHSNRILLNPTFSGSTDIGGADADMILDGCLIDIKATINPKLDKQWLYQLLGYTLLDYHDQHEIKSVGIMYARQGFMLQWALDEILTTTCGESAVPDITILRAEFQKMMADMQEHERRLRKNKDAS